MILLLILGLAGVILFEVPGLIKKRYWRELVAFSVFLCLSLILSLLMALGIELPNVTTAISNFVEALFRPSGRGAR